MFYILYDVTVWHPLGDHSKSGIRRIVPATDSDESQYVRMV